jgi:hypothetical protein
MAGGAPLNIKSHDEPFSKEAQNHRLRYTTSGFNGVEVTFDNLPPLIEEKDLYRSNTGANRLVYTAPAITELFEGKTLADFEQYVRIEM